MKILTQGVRRIAKETLSIKVSTNGFSFCKLAKC